VSELIYEDRVTGATALFIPRTEWGSRSSTEDWIRHRIEVDRKVKPASFKTEVHVHHTAGVDTDTGEPDEDDPTPNLWEYASAVAYMRRLEYIRPDLGPLPYSENIALSEDRLTVWFFEGRGLQVQGAHTKYHNVDGIGWSFLGNLSRSDARGMLAGVAIPMLNRRLYDLRHNGGFTRLGDVTNPRGWEVWGHRDTKRTNCPGDNLYPLLADLSFVSGGPGLPITPPPDPTPSEREDMYRQVIHRDGFGVDGGDPDVAAWQRVIVHKRPGSLGTYGPKRDGVDGKFGDVLKGWLETNVPGADGLTIDDVVGAYILGMYAEIPELPDLFPPEDHEHEQTTTGGVVRDE
jgi:hypothetical protein